MKPKRDVSIELARILVCIFVIGVHACLPVFDDKGCDFNRVFISCLVADGVAVFWLIMGCFLFKSESYKTVLQKTLKSTIFPMFCFSVIVFYTIGWFAEGKTLMESVTYLKEDYVFIIDTLLTWENPVPYIGHLWYLYIYIMVIFIFPVLKSFVDYLDLDIQRTKWFLFLSFLFFVMNDISDNKLAGFSHHSINAVVPASIEIIWGHILYRNRDKFMKRQVFVPSIVLFFALNYFRTIVQYKRYTLNQGNHILYWYSGIGLICSVCLIVFCFQLTNRIKEGTGKVLNSIAIHTFNIYLVHPLVIAKLQNYGIQDKIYQSIVQINNSSIGESSYTTIVVLVIFLISLGVSFIFTVLERNIVLFVRKKSIFRST